MRNEALELQQLRESCGRRARVPAITSGKGEVVRANIRVSPKVSPAISLSSNEIFRKIADWFF